MAGPLLRPEDVSPEAARRVLAALNAAASPEELAATIELAGEPDIGVRLASRLLARRAELGGFATLAQVADVPLIGPERFDDLVRALAGDAGAVGAGSADPELRAEVARLRGLVEGLTTALGSRDRLTLRVVADRRYFGQLVTVAARLTDALGREPRIDAPVTFVAAWGRLRTEGGVRPQAGETVAARTGADGTARVTLLPPAAEDLDPEQEVALEAALSDLDPEAPDPEAAAAVLRELARQYRWDAGVRFREAVDVYVKHFRSALLDAVNQWDVWSAWPLVQATVLAFSVGDGAGGTEVRTSAALTLQQRNWLPAFVDACESVAREQSTLTEDLRDAVGRVADKGRFLGEVHGRVQEYLEAQRGLVGEHVGRRLAERELSRFATEDLEDLPVAVRVDLFPALHAAAGAVAEAGGRLVAALGQTRLDLGKDLDVKLGQLDAGALAGLGERVGALEGRVAGKLDASAFAGFKDQVEGRFAAVAEAAALDGLRAEVTLALAGKADQAKLAAFQEATGAALAAKVDQGAFASYQKKTSEALAAKVDQETFTTFQGDVDTRLDAKVDQVAFDEFRFSVGDRFDLKAGAADLAALDEKVSGQLQDKVDVATLSALRKDLSARLDAKADQATFATFRDAVNQKLDLKADAAAVNALRADVAGALAQKADAAAVTAELGVLRDRTLTLDQGLKTLDTSVTRIDGSVATLLRPREAGRPAPKGGGG